MLLSLWTMLLLTYRKVGFCKGLIFCVWEQGKGMWRNISFCPIYCSKWLVWSFKIYCVLKFHHLHWWDINSQMDWFMVILKVQPIRTICRVSKTVHSTLHHLASYLHCEVLTKCMGYNPRVMCSQIVYVKCYDYKICIHNSMTSLPHLLLPLKHPPPTPTLPNGSKWNCL